jgi:hypothetical protein
MQPRGGYLAHVLHQAGFMGRSLNIRPINHLPKGTCSKPLRVGKASIELVAIARQERSNLLLLSNIIEQPHVILALSI